jgi:hypothetical protein
LFVLIVNVSRYIEIVFERIDFRGDIVLLKHFLSAVRQT